MKRSEMVKKVQDLLNGGFDPCHTEDQASDFLAKLEEFGMKPPMCERGFDRDGYASKTPPSYRWERE